MKQNIQQQPIQINAINNGGAAMNPGGLSG